MSLYLRGGFAALALSAIAAGADVAPCNSGPVASSQIIPGEPLSLPVALAELRRVSPAIRAAGLEARALSAEADQAGRWLNPSLSL
ncbi:MAG TPA: TolC family protein, partial [Hyphomonas sp.]|nr:TolC family protein [Hyphomonas sp.]